MSLLLVLLKKGCGVMLNAIKNLSDALLLQVKG